MVGEITVLRKCQHFGAISVKGIAPGAGAQAYIRWQKLHMIMLYNNAKNRVANASFNLGASFTSIGPTAGVK